MSRPESKYCAGCFTVKSTEYFAHNRNKEDDCQTWCKNCNALWSAGLALPNGRRRWR